MLIAITIYQMNPTTGLFQKIKSTQSRQGFFYENPLEYVEANYLPHLSSSSLKQTIYSFEQDKYYYYIKALSEKPVIAVMMSKKMLDNSELMYLFSNIKTIYTKPTINHSLNDIVMNPFGYTGKDILISEASTRLAETKDIAIESINTLLSRNELLEDLQSKTDQFVIDTGDFRDEAKKLRRCCSII